MLASSWEQNKKSDGKANGVSLGCSPYWPIPQQRGGMNPTPATTQDGLVFLLVHFLFESFLFPLKEWINLNIGLRFKVRYCHEFYLYWTG